MLQLRKCSKGVDNVVVGGVRLVAAVGWPPRSSVELGLVWPGRVWFGPGSGRSGTIERFRDSAKVFPSDFNSALTCATVPQSRTRQK